jgi:hypothetical protein
MTFQEALEEKKEIGDVTTVHGLEFKVYVSPYNLADFENWRDFYFKNNFDFNAVKFTDEVAKQYSTDSRFKVYGLYQLGTIISTQVLKDY